MCVDYELKYFCILKYLMITVDSEYTCCLIQQYESNKIKIMIKPPSDPEIKDQIIL